MRSIHWILPAALILGYSLYVMFSGVALIMGSGEHIQGRFEGLQSISYIEASE